MTPALCTTMSSRSVPLHGVVYDPPARAGTGDVQLQCSAPYLVCHCCQLVPRCRNVHQDQRGAIAVQRPGNLGTDAAGCAGYYGHFSCKWPLRVRGQRAVFG
ncbi:hypothetical protein QFZ60_002017 [Arthrobacter sp. B2I5]|nr:hypothetical protein [Arthrobacter sp. B2I5]